MDVLHELAADGALAGTVVLAGEQLQGRGSRGRPWHSPPGGLWLSVLFRPQVLEGLEVISIRTGLAVAEALESLVPEPLQLKWPNDLMLGERKLGGVLCEARWQGAMLGWVAVGLGLNVRNEIPDDLRSTAIALVEVQPEITAEHLADHLVASLRRLELEAGPLSPSELRRFADRDWLRGRLIREPVAGTVQGLTDDGSLLVRSAAGSDVALRSGSVELAASPTAGSFDHAARPRYR
jgi:BirA family transcriptional regulator, biotin operon repressor / biotin---[acetyl-CoA-carboxylase] ligase